MENGDHEMKDDDDCDKEEVMKGEATEFRAVAARVNFLGQDSPELQFPAKETSREMAKPRRGSWKRLKKMMRFLVDSKRVFHVEIRVAG